MTTISIQKRATETRLGESLFIELDARTGVLSLTTEEDTDLGSAPGHVLRWAIPSRHAADANALLGRVALAAWTIVAGHSSEDGCAVYSSRAVVAVAMVKQICERVSIG